MKDNLSNKNSKVLAADKHDIQDTAYLSIVDIPRPKNAVFVTRLQIKPAEQKTAPLGSFTEETTPKGFLIEVGPDPFPAGSVTTDVTRQGNARHHSLHLEVVNSSPKTIDADVWRL